jgi:hypothetical protein
MSTHLTRVLSPAFGLGLAAALALALAACDRGAAPKSESAAPANAELSWARAALQRNPELEVVATDPQSGVITVKHRSTGQVEAIKASELAAVSPSQLREMNLQAAAPEPERDSVQEDSPTGAEQSAQATAPERGEGAPPVPGSTPSGYKIERADGQVRVSGPGVSIVSSGASASAGDQASAGRRAVDPFICEGRRTLQLDNRDIYVDGDAITVRGGCELFLTNSHIVASGTGIVVEDATVHISNSHVEGRSASFQADDRAKMYVRGSTFQGVPRRGELAMVQDQGGNRWR